MTYQNYLADRGDMWQLQMNYMKPQYQSPALDVRRSADPYNPLIFITNNTTSQSNVTQSRSVASVGTGLLSAVAAAPAIFPAAEPYTEYPARPPPWPGPPPWPPPPWPPPWPPPQFSSAYDSFSCSAPTNNSTNFTPVNSYYVSSHFTPSNSSNNSMYLSHLEGWRAAAAPPPPPAPQWPGIGQPAPAAYIPAHNNQNYHPAYNDHYNSPAHINPAPAPAPASVSQPQPSQNVRHPQPTANSSRSNVGGKYSRNNRKRKINNSNKIIPENLVLMSCNVRSITNKTKSLENTLATENVDFCILQEINTKKMQYIKGYFQFNLYSQRKFHGVSILAKNFYKNKIMRIPHEEEEHFELVHIIMKDTVPTLNILGCYLDVESRQKVDQVESSWLKFTGIVEEILARGESVVCLGDYNRVMNPENKRLTTGAKLVKDWLEEGQVVLANNLDIPTRVDPHTGKGSTLDLAIVSKNIEGCVKEVSVDTDRNFTPFSMRKVKGEIVKKHTDHLAITLKLKIFKRKGAKVKKRPVINFQSKEGWQKYPEISNKYSEKIKDIIKNHEDTNEIMRKLKIVDEEICTEAFGIIWKGQGKKTGKKNKSSKDIKDLYQEQLGELETMLSEGLVGKDITQKMYNMRKVIKGSKVQPQETMAINDPQTGELITEDEEIKRVSLAHNVKILTKNEPREEDKDEIMMKREAHLGIMNKGNQHEWKLDRGTFLKVMEKAKEKNKNFYKLFNKAGEHYKWAIFELMAKIIDTEQIPDVFKDTSLTPVWKRKGSALQLQNMRFIHMRIWQSRLLAALVTDKIKPKVVKATPNIQLGGIPGASSVEHLVVLKTWMKMLEDKKGGGIFQCFDMEKFFDKESLVDCMDVLKHEADIDNKSYRLIYMMNEDTKISVSTSVGQTQQAIIKDSIGQGSPEAALISSCSIGTAIKNTFRFKISTRIGGLGLNCLIFQDDISKLNDRLEDAREGCKMIDETLKKKQLSVNYDKSKFIVFGDKKYRNKVKKELEKNPMMMGKVRIGQSINEKYVGDQIHEKGCEQSITETIKERKNKLKRTVHEIIETCENPLMDGLSSAKCPFKLFEAQVIPSLLTNCESWIGITDKHIEDLQKFQDEFIRKVLRIAKTTTKAIINWDIGLAPMKWRIAERKMQFVRKTIWTKPVTNIARKALVQEVLCKVKGLAHECRKFSWELGLPNIMCINKTKNEIKEAIKAKIIEEYRDAMEDQKKVKDRLTDNPEDNSYINTLSLPLTRIWFRYRARAIAKVKCNFKQSYNDLSCDFCSGNEEMSQSHVEICGGTWFERRGLDMSTRKGLLDFWRRMTSRLARLPAAAVTHGGSSTGDPT